MKLRPAPPEPKAWLRGQASIEDELIVLDPTASTEFLPLEEDHLLFDLAALQRPADAIPFARRYGLLRHGPGSEEWAEPWTEWESTASLLRGLLHVWIHLRRALKGDPLAEDELRQRWLPIMNSLYEGEPPDAEAGLMRISDALCAHISEGLSDVGIGVDAGFKYQSEGQPVGGIDSYLFIVKPPTLVGYAYYQFAMVMTKGEPARTCADCGRVFLIRDRRQRFCSDGCAQRARYRRWKAKKGKENS
jgi:hypothetical protein